VILPIARFFFGGVFRALASSTAIDHFAFDGAGRKAAVEGVTGTVEGKFDKWVDEKVDGLFESDPDSLVPSLIKDNWKKGLGLAATLPFMTNQYTRNIAIFAAVAIALYAAYDYFTKTRFNVASEASNPDRVAELYASMGLNADGTAALDNPLAWASQGGADHVEEPKLWQSFEKGSGLEKARVRRWQGLVVKSALEKLTGDDDPEITNE
jgi:hypothetical protein